MLAKVIVFININQSNIQMHDFIKNERTNDKYVVHGELGQREEACVQVMY